MPSKSDNMPNPKGFVIPIRPTGEKIIALWLALKAIGKHLNEVEIVSYSSSDENDPFLAQKFNEGFYLVDVGFNKYQSRQTGSAVETVVSDFGIDDPILLPLVAIANKNNRTGYLKAYAAKFNPRLGEDWEFKISSWALDRKVKFNTSELNWASFWILRDSYKVDWNVNEVIVHMHNLLDAWEQIQRGNVDEAHWQRRLSQHGRVHTMWNLFGSPSVDSLSPFSIPQLVYQLAVCGDDELEFSSRQIEREVAWWMKVQRAITAERLNARSWAFSVMDKLKRFNPFDPENNPIGNGSTFKLEHCEGITGIFLEATEMQAREIFGQNDDDDVVTQLMNVIFKGQANEQKFGLAIIRDPQTRQVAILAGKRPLDFNGVVARLQGLEAQLRKNETKCWHLDIKQPGTNRERHQLLNGSPGWPLPATVIYPKTIVTFVMGSTYFMGERPQPQHSKRK